jgi:anti-sigma regulatory factor (Ser/Thr protein kinase)
MAALAARLSGSVGTAEDACDRALTALGPDSYADDTAILAVVRTGSADAPALTAAIELSASTREVRSARRFVDATLRDWNLPSYSQSVVLAVNELVANAARHATGPVRIQLDRGPQALTVNVWDASPAAPAEADPGPYDEGGRGLRIVTALTDRWGSEHLRSGKRVWFELDLPS